jgi:nitrous oxide reductase accessory protein NosL
MENGNQRRPRIRRVASVTCLFLVFVFLMVTSSCGSSSGVVPASATMGTCPVCHMRVKASDDWAAEIYFKDGTKLLFESPGDMLAFYLAPETFLSDAAHNNVANIDRIVVKDYQSKQPIDARQATLVFKSRVEGPMGPDFLPFGKREDAEAFVAANGGTLLSLGGVVSPMVRDLRK